MCERKEIFNHHHSIFLISNRKYRNVNEKTNKPFFNDTFSSVVVVVVVDGQLSTSDVLGDLNRKRFSSEKFFFKLKTIDFGCALKFFLLLLSLF